MITWSSRVLSCLTRHCRLPGYHHHSVKTITNMARIVKVYPELKGGGEEPSPLSLAAESLEAGHVIAVPTDTIYGVAALAQNPEAIKKLYDIKQRDILKPVAISVGEVDDLYRWGKVTVSRDLLCDLLPGPVTLVFDRTPALNPALNQGVHSVGIRIPDCQFVRDLARMCTGPVALTSANVSTAQSTLSIQEFRELWPHLDLVCDGGRIGDTPESRLGSTVVDLTIPGHFRIIRDGSAYKPTVDLLRNKYNLSETKSQVNGYL